MSEINEPLFARIENGQIVEYPVTTEQIRNRKAPLSMFKQVSFIDPKPQVTQFQHLEENVILVDGVVKVTYKVTDMTLQEILNRLHQDQHIRLRKVDLIIEQPFPELHHHYNQWILFRKELNHNHQFEQCLLFL